ATARTSYWPSCRCRPSVSHVAPGKAVQVEALESLKLQAATGDGSASMTVAVKETDPATPPLPSGLVMLTAGAVLSTRTFATVGEVAALPALSRAITC